METQLAKPGKIQVRWVRGSETIDYRNPLVILSLGVRGAGKSAYLEDVAEQYLYDGQNVLDLFGASSGEGLGWLRSDWVQKENLPVLLLRGERVSVDAPWPSKSWKELTLEDLERNRITISATPLYESKEEEFRASGSTLDLLFKRYDWSKYIALIVRESANLFYSRMKLKQDQLAAKAEASYLIRESRHHGLSLLLDTQKMTSIDIDLRSLSDFLIFKSQGIFSIPREFWFLYRYFNPSWIRNMKQSQFAILSRRGNIGIGVNGLPPWHKRARENLLKALDIRVDVAKEGGGTDGE